MIRLRIPATSANIGPGFDSIGLAVGLYNEVTMEEWDGVQIEAWTVRLFRRGKIT